MGDDSQTASHCGPAATDLIVPICVCRYLLADTTFEQFNLHPQCYNSLQFT